MQKVLIVDDEPAVRAFLEDSLVKAKFEIARASSGPEALSLVTSVKPDIILLDIRMPGMDGLEVLKRLRQSSSTKGVPVMFLTGTVLDVDELVQTLELDPADFVTKNASSREIVARVRWVLRRSEHS